MNDCGIIVGCDNNQQWLLNWWWNHYSVFNKYPVAFIDFGMDKQGIDWCKEKGLYIKPDSCPYTLSHPISDDLYDFCLKRYGKAVLDTREAWLKKPLAFYLAPFSRSIWIDLDCEVLGDLSPLFHALMFDVEVAAAKDIGANVVVDKILGFKIYNTGVVAFKKNASFIEKWMRAISDPSRQYAGDQEFFSSIISKGKENFLELSTHYNWPYDLEGDEKIICHYYCGGKKHILRSFDPKNIQEIDIPHVLKK